MTWSGASSGEHFLASNPPSSLASSVAVPAAGSTLTGGVLSGAIADWGGEAYNVKSTSNPSGPAKGDVKTFVAGAMTNTLSTLTDVTNAPFVPGDVNKKIDIYPTVLTTPLPDAFDYTTTGGSLAAGTYWYRISATNAFGETLASAELSVVIPAGTSTNTAVIGWFGVTGATGYKVYGRTVNGELLIAAVGAVTTYTDTGALTPSGALPASNTTANSAMTLSGLTITGYTSSSIVTVSSPATATVAGQSYSFGTSDTASLNAVVGSNRKVVVPPGIYWEDNTWSWNGLNNWIIEAAGKGASIIRRGNATNHRMIDVLTCQKYIIRDIGLDQTGVTNNNPANCHGLYIDFNCNDGRVDSIGVTNSPGLAIFVFGGPNLWAYNLRVWNNDVTCLDGATFDVINVISKGGSTCFNRVWATACLAINIYESRDHPCIANPVQLNGQGGVGIRVSSSLGCPVSLNPIIGSLNDYGIQIVKETDNARATPQTEALIDGNTLRGSASFICFGLINATGVDIRNNLCDGNFVVVNYISGTNDDITFENNRIIGNTNSVFSGTVPVTKRYRNNKGYNPVGGPLGTIPAVPGSGAFATNNTGYDCNVYISTGAGVTVSVILLAGVLSNGAITGVTMAQNSTYGPVPVEAGEQIQLTYAGGTPTWQWFGK